MNELFRRALWLPPQASSLAHRIDVLHYVVIGTAFAVALAVFALIAFMLVYFREREGQPRRPARKVPAQLEIVLGAFALTVFLVFWVVGFAQFRAIREVTPDAARIYIVAKQWMWEAVYPDGSSLQDEIRVPLGRPVVLLMTSRDVIHSFYVPDFRLKEDVLPGRTTTLEFTATEPGEHDILCAEYCGTGHSRMRGKVIALPPAEYAAWMSSHPSADLTLAGEKIAAEHGCLRCHTVDGTPHLGPTWRGLYGKTETLTTGAQIVVDDAYLTESMMDPFVKMVAGYGPIMPSYLGELTAPETASIVEYIRSLR